MDDSQIATTKAEDEEGDVNDLASRSPRGNSSLRSHSASRSPELPDVSNIRDAKLAIAQRHRKNPDEDSSLLPMEDLDRPELGSAVTATTANSSWSQLPIAQPIDVSAQESSLSLLPNSGIVPISASQIDRGEISSIRDELLRRASVRSSNNSGGLRSVSQVTTTDTDLTKSLSSGGTPSSEPVPRRHILETTEELEVADDEADHPSSSKQYVNQRERESCVVRSNTTIAVIAVLVVIVAAVVAGVCLSGQCKGTENGPSTTPSPTVFVDRRIRISEFVQSITLTKVRIVYPKPQSWTPTNQEKALYWLLDDDPLQLQGFEYELSRVRQRFALLSIWFSTVPQSLWKNTTNWLTGTHECDWANVVCSETSTDRQVTDVRITQLDVGASGVVGVIPDDLALLSDSLQHLQLAYNGLTGTIPSSLGLLTKLTFFDAEGNFLNGTIPSSLSRWSELEVFRVRKNDLAGTIPNELGQWTNANVFTLSDNEITGTVPTSLGKMSLLQFLWIQNTLISGSLPTSLSILVNATEVFVFNTKLNGTMPICNQDDPVFGSIVADCNEVICPCCTYCCPDRFDTISAYAGCAVGAR